MIKTLQELTPDVDIQAVAQDASNIIGSLGTQPQQDAQMMEQQLSTQTIQEPIKGTKTAGLSSFLAKQIAKRQKMAGIGAKEEAARVAQRLTPEVEQKATIMTETKLSDLNEADPHQFNFDTIQNVDDVAKEFAVMNELNKEAIQTQRRNIVPDEELNILANDLSSDTDTIKKVLGLKPGEILAPEYILSMKQTLNQSAVKLKDLSQKIVSGQATDMEKINFHKQWEFHSQFTTQFMGVRAEYGRGLRALGLQPENSTSDLNELTNRMSAGTLDTVTMAQQLLMAADNKSMNRVIQDQKKGLFSKTGDVFSELFISSILSGVQTHVVNVTSNALKSIAMPLDTAVASMFKADGTDVIGKGEGLAQLKGMWEANIEALDIAFRVLKTGEAYGGIDKLDVDYQKAISANALGIKEGVAGTMVDVMGKFVRFSTDNLMGAEDAYFKVLNERGKIRQLAHRKANEQGLTGSEYNNFVANFMENTPRDANEQAKQAGLQATYQQQLGTAGQGIQKVRENIVGGKFIMPFIKTPINLLYEGFVERTPLGLASKNFQDAIKEGGAKAQMAKAKMAIGTSVNSLVLGTFYGLEYGNDSGIEVFGAFPQDPKLRQTWKDNGIQENSIAFKDENGRSSYVSFDRLEPFNSVFKLYANVMQVQKIANLNDLNPDQEKELAKVGAGLSLAFAEATVNQTFMRGIKDTMDALTQGSSVKKLEGIIANYASAFVPNSGALRNITKAFDDQVKEADGILERVKRGLPLLAKDQPPILDNYGKPMTYDNNFLPSFYKPGTEGSNDKVRNEVYRVTDVTKSVPIYKPAKNFGGYRMTGDEYHYYTSTATTDKVNGKTMYDALKDTINSYAYKKSSDHIKALYLNSVRDGYYEYGKAKLFQKYPHIMKYDLDKKEYESKLLQGE